MQQNPRLTALRELKHKPAELGNYGQRSIGVFEASRRFDHTFSSLCMVAACLRLSLSSIRPLPAQQWHAHAHPSTEDEIGRTGFPIASKMLHNLGG